MSSTKKIKIEEDASLEPDPYDVQQDYSTVQIKNEPEPFDDDDDDDLLSDQDESISNQFDEQEIQIKTEITTEETQVEKYSEFETNRLKFRCELCDIRCGSRISLWKHHKTKHPEDKTSRCLICFVRVKGEAQLEKHIEDEHQGLGNKCKFCSVQYKKGEWDKHEKQCRGRLLFICTKCKQRYASKEGLYEHLDEHDVPEELKELSISKLRVKEQVSCCVVCEDGRVYKSGPLKKHAKEKHDGYYLQCSHCKKTFRCPGSRYNHMTKFCKANPQRLHTEKKIQEKTAMNKQKFFCKFCDVSRRSRSALLKHTARTHPEDGTFKCSICRTMFSGMSELEKHIAEVHHGLGNECSICLAQYQKGQGAEHKTKCLGRQLFNCNGCPVRFLNKEALWKHLDQHGMPEDLKESSICETREKERFHSCVICADDRAYTKAPFKKHVEEQHDGHHLKCPDCGKTFKCSGTRVNHVKKYCKVRSARERLKAKLSECPECSKTFRDTTALEEHIAKNHRKKSLNCSKCDIEFQNSKTLRYHMVKHHTEPSFGCSLCSKKFHFEFLLRRHVGLHEKRGESQNASCDKDL